MLSVGGARLAADAMHTHSLKSEMTAIHAVEGSAQLENKESAGAELEDGRDVVLKLRCVRRWAPRG